MAEASPNTVVPRLQLSNNPVLESLKAAMGDSAYLLESLHVQNIPIEHHNDDDRLPKKTTSQFKIRLGIYNDREENQEHPIFAYLVQSSRDTKSLEMAAYLLPSNEEELGEQISCADLKQLPSFQLLEIFTTVNSADALRVLIKVFFIFYKIDVREPVELSKKFVKDVDRFCRSFVKQCEDMSSGQKRSSNRVTAPMPTTRGHPSGPLNETNESATRSRRISSGVGRSSGASRSLPASLSPANRSLNRSAIEPKQFSISQLDQEFTKPMEAAQAEEKRINDRINYARQRLDRTEEDIAKLKNDMAEAERMKSNLRNEISEYERQRDRALAEQGRLVDSLDPHLKAFVRVGRAIRLPEDGEPSAKRQRRS